MVRYVVTPMSALNHQSTDVWSGRSLNVLYDSIVKNGKLNRGPNITLDEDTLGRRSTSLPGPRAATPVCSRTAAN